MKINNRESIQTDIKKAVEVILHEIELRDVRPVSGIIPVRIASKKFEHPEDLGKIVDKINEGETHRVLSIVSEYTFNKSLYHNKITAESIAKLMQTRSALDLLGIEEEWLEKRYYFLVEDIDRLREVQTELEKLTETSRSKPASEQWLFSFDDKTGDFFVRGELIILDKEAQYYYVVRSLWRQAVEDEFLETVSYEKIYKGLDKHTKIKLKLSPHYDPEMRRMINNAIDSFQELARSSKDKERLSEILEADHYQLFKREGKGVGRRIVNKRM